MSKILSCWPFDNFQELHSEFYFRKVCIFTISCLDLSKLNHKLAWLGFHCKITWFISKLNTKNVDFIKKQDLLAEKQDLFEKKVRKSHFSEKKVLGCKKTGIANSKIDKNRIYLRRKGDDKNRKKKDFFPPYMDMIWWQSLFRTRTYRRKDFRYRL